MPKGNLGTIAAQRALFKVLIDGGIDLSVSTSDQETFKYTHSEYKSLKVYGSLQPNIGVKETRSYLQWAIFSIFNLTLFTFMAPLMRLGVKFPSKREVINRIKSCDILMDLNLELFRGIPISVSPSLISQKPYVLTIHKIFWSFRILQHLWFLFLIKSIFKKKLVVGPASYGPFEGLPIIIKWLVKTFLNKFIDLVLVREPYSARLLRELGVKNYCIVTDIAVLARAEEPRFYTHFRHFGSAIGVAPASLKYTFTRAEVEAYVAAHAKLLDELVAQGERMIFLPSTPEDEIMCRMIISRMENKDRVKIIVTNNVNVYESLISGLKILITTRMHPSIIASRNFVPFVSIIHDHKQIGFMMQIGFSHLSIPFSKVSYDNLRSKINELIKNYDEIKKVLKNNVCKLQYLQKEKILHLIHLLVS